jgi:hypothetical protein
VEKLPNPLDEFPRSYASHVEGLLRSWDMRIREDRDDFAVPVYNRGAEAGDDGGARIGRRPNGTAVASGCNNGRVAGKVANQWKKECTRAAFDVNLLYISWQGP